jgi:molybdopterin-guanine dinucleotide biosynthesis protein B
MPDNVHSPILGFAAFSGTGKTTLLLKLIPLLKTRGLRVGVIKHAHHSFEIDRPGKDSFELRRAGAPELLIASRHHWALMVETPGQDEPQLDQVLPHLPQKKLDLVLVEGFKKEPIPKIELHRPELGRPLLFPDDPNIIAIATDAPLTTTSELPILNLNAPEEILAFILHWRSKKKHAGD